MAACMHSNACKGATLIEVLLAVAVMAVSTLGTVAVQLWTARHAQAVAQREDAVWIADALIEAARAPQSADAVSAQWKARAATLLPRVDIAVQTSGAGGPGAARVMWWSSDGEGSPEWNGSPDTCGGVTVPKGFACAAIAFVR